MNYNNFYIPIQKEFRLSNKESTLRTNINLINKNDINDENQNIKIQNMLFTSNDICCKCKNKINLKKNEIHFPSNPLFEFYSDFS